MYGDQHDTARPLGALAAGNFKSFTLQEGEDYRQIAVIPMSVADWLAVPDNPIQRNTEERAARAVHLKTFEPVHAEVSMAVLPDGSRFKIDGHTRAYKWASGEVENAPLHVDVKVYGCRNLAAVTKLYGRFDSKLAAETTRDQIEGAVRRAGISFTSAMLKGGKFANAVKRLHGEIFVYDPQRWSDPNAMADAIWMFREELLLLDSVHPSPARFTTGVVQAALATFMAHGEEALPFWQAYAANAGQKSRTQMDAIQALWEALQVESRKRSMDAHANLYRKGIMTFINWRRGNLYSVGKGQSVKGINPDAAREFSRNAYRRRQGRVV